MAVTFTQLADSVGQIDTSDQLMAFEGFQKAFVVNGANLGVVDLINTKLTHSALTTAHAHGDILTQATSNAQMVVDFTDSTKTHTYGYVTTGTFDATHAVTGSGSGTGFTPSAVTSRPHWYDWTVYPGGASGSLPDKAYIGCLYRGRCVLAGNPNEPQQWYMSRQANPWDWAYTANDALSPVAGQSAAAGKMGDIIKALIPYRDEYLIIGCANSVWVMRGDPAEGGGQQAYDEAKGIFGVKSWCFDHEGNLYFFSLTGMYMIPVGFGPIQEISQVVLPQLNEDEAIDPAVHRITMEFDKQHYGIEICITDVINGTNSNYWYDLKTKGFFPESYPDSASAYSLLFYDATDPDNRVLLYGSKDGFIRTLDDATKSDATTASTQAITSHILLPIIQSADDDKDIKLTGLSLTLAGGLSSGSEADSGTLTVNYFADKTTEAVLEDVEDGDTPFSTFDVALSSYAKLEKYWNRIRDHAIGIQLKNTTADNTWAIERVSAVLSEARR